MVWLWVYATPKPRYLGRAARTIDRWILGNPMQCSKYSGCYQGYALTSPHSLWSLDLAVDWQVVSSGRLWAQRELRVD